MSNHNEHAFANRLKEKRKETGMMQKQFAEVLGVKNTTYCNWENGKAFPNILELKMICEKLQVSADYLLDIPFIQPLKKDLSEQEIETFKNVLSRCHITVCINEQK